MLPKYKQHKIFIFGSLLWDIICRPISSPNVGVDNAGTITESPGGVAYNLALGLSKELDKKLFSIHLVSVTGQSYQTKIQLEKLRKNCIETNFLVFKGKNIDKYVSIETMRGEIFSSVNSCEVFSDNENIIFKQFCNTLSNLDAKFDQSTFIFDGNLSKNFFLKITSETRLKSFNNYFIPANFQKLYVFSNDPVCFNNFSLLLNLREANVLGKSNFDNSPEACKHLSKLLKNQFRSIVITNGSKIACGIAKKKLFMKEPRKLTKNSSRSGAGDFFFANYIAANLKNPAGSYEEKLEFANERTYKYLNYIK